MRILTNLYHYRSYILNNSWNDIRYRYSGTGIGFLWHFVNPIIMIMMYTMVFFFIFYDRSGGNYTFYLISGVIVWQTFSNTILRGSNAFIENARYLKHLAIPSEIFVARTTASETAILTLHFLLFLLIAFLSGCSVYWTIVFLPFFLLLIQILAFSIALILAGLQAFFHDIRHIIEAFLPLWLWTLPVIYPEKIVPECYRIWLYMNPPYVFIKAIRDVILNDRIPDSCEWIIIVLWLIFLFGTCSFVHEKLKHEVSEVI
ncbi:MAG: ABC transporter permease [Candidatus Magnetomorum sp.]|nr:ABC transporter permease [Candidatus Magnetomorum sp.]